MLMRERLAAAFHRRHGQAVDVVAAAGEQADDAGEDARLVVHQDGDRRAAQCGVGHVRDYCHGRADRDPGGTAGRRRVHARRR